MGTGLSSSLLTSSHSPATVLILSVASSSVLPSAIQPARAGYLFKKPILRANRILCPIYFLSRLYNGAPDLSSALLLLIYCVSFIIRVYSLFQILLNSSNTTSQPVKRKLILCPIRQILLCIYTAQQVNHFNSAQRAVVSFVSCFCAGSLYCLLNIIRCNNSEHNRDTGFK